MDLNSLMKSTTERNNLLKTIINSLEELKFEVNSIKSRVSNNKELLQKQQDNIQLYTRSKEVINNIILKTRNEAIEFIENVVNCALQDVFGTDRLKLKLVLKTEGAKTSISTFIEEDGELFDIESGRGGGLRDLVSTAILLCCRTIAKPRIELPLLLDESFKFLHSTKDNKFKGNAFKFLQTVANKLNIQIILITGEEDKEAIACADNVIYIYKKDRQSYLGNS